MSVLLHWTDWHLNSNNIRLLIYIHSAKVFEEEDFDPRDYGYVLTPDVINTKACFMLKEAEDDLMRKAKLAPDGTEAIQGVIHRLRLLRLYLQALAALTPSKSVSPNEQEMNEIVRLLNNAIDLTPLIKRTINLGTQPDPSGECCPFILTKFYWIEIFRAILDDAPNPIGFSPTVNQRILPPTFPRYTKIKARDTSIAFFEELVQRTKQACKIIHCVNYHSALVGNVLKFTLKSNIPKFVFI